MRATDAFLPFGEPMSTPVPPMRPRFFGAWFIQTPAPTSGSGGSATVSLNADGTVTVVVDDNSDGNLGYRAGIYNASDSRTAYADCTIMGGPDASDLYTE